MKIIYLLLLLLPLIEVDAFYCSYSDLARTKGLASNINVTYDFKEENGSAIFSIKLTNLHESLYLIDTSTSKVYNYSGNELVIDNYKSGQKVKFDIYTNIENCEDILHSITVKLPSYNPYYLDEVCEGVEGYSLCQRWTSHNLNYEQFVKNVEKHKTTNEEIIVEPDPGENEDSNWDIILRYFTKTYFIPLLVIIVGCSVGIYFIDKKNSIYR